MSRSKQPDLATKPLIDAISALQKNISYDNHFTKETIKVAIAAIVLAVYFSADVWSSVTTSTTIPIILKLVFILVSLSAFSFAGYIVFVAVKYCPIFDFHENWTFLRRFFSDGSNFFYSFASMLLLFFSVIPLLIYGIVDLFDKQKYFELSLVGLMLILAIIAYLYQRRKKRPLTVNSVTKSQKSAPDPKNDFVNFISSKILDLLLQGIVLLIIFGVFVIPMITPSTNVSVNLSRDLDRNTTYFSFSNSASFSGDDFSILIEPIDFTMLEYPVFSERLCKGNKVVMGLTGPTGAWVDCSYLPPRSTIAFGFKDFHSTSEKFNVTFWSKNTQITKITCDSNKLICN